ncbi:hypothetical protein C8Q79DRAFT_1012718 [Trametes meyenii]|nr:hypothetical protein C8Q79DRAFT_1012718 [Trametes meyenii]
MSSTGDAAVLKTVGHDFIRSFVAITVQTFVLGIYAVLVYISGRLLLEKRRAKVSYWTLGAVLLMFFMAFTLWIIDIHNVVLEVQTILLRNPTESLEDRYTRAVDELRPMAYAIDILYAFLTNVGDSVIVWRVYVFWSMSRMKAIVLLPLACLLGSITTSFLVTYCATHVGADIEIGAFRNPPFCRRIQTASYIMTLVTTAVATALIAYKAWEHQRRHKEAFGQLSTQTRTQKVMLMIIESGVLYMLFFLWQVISSLKPSLNNNPSVSFGLTVYNFCTSLIVGIYPTIIVILAHSKHSMLWSGKDSTRSTGHEVIVFKNVHVHRSTHRGELDGPGSATAVPGRTPVTTVNLYEMSNLSSAELPDGNKESL